MAAGKPAKPLGVLRALGQSGDELVADGRRGRRDRRHAPNVTILFSMEFGAELRPDRDLKRFCDLAGPREAGQFREAALGLSMISRSPSRRPAARTLGSRRRGAESRCRRRTWRWPAGRRRRGRTRSPETPGAPRPARAGRRRARSPADGFVGAGPLAHRPFERPMTGAHQRGHHFREAFARWKRGEVAEMAAVLVAQFAPRFDECGAVLRDVGEVPVEAALGHAKATAQPVDLERLDALFGQDREAGLDPVVDRQPAVGVGLGPPHERQPTARDTAENNADATSDLSQEYDSQRWSGFLACRSHVLLQRDN